MAKQILSLSLQLLLSLGSTVPASHTRSHDCQGNAFDFVEFEQDCSTVHQNPVALATKSCVPEFRGRPQADVSCLFSWVGLVTRLLSIRGRSVWDVRNTLTDYRLQHCGSLWLVPQLTSRVLAVGMVPCCCYEHPTGPQRAQSSKFHLCETSWASGAHGLRILCHGADANNLPCELCSQTRSLLSATPTPALAGHCFALELGHLHRVLTCLSGRFSFERSCLRPQTSSTISGALGTDLPAQSTDLWS